MPLARRAACATILLRGAAAFALIGEASLVRLIARFGGEAAALLPLAAAAQIGGGMLLLFGLLTRWVALIALCVVGAAALLVPDGALALTVLWIAALAAIALLGARATAQGRNLPLWRYIDGLARGPDIFK